MTARQWLAELAWLPVHGVRPDVLIEASGDRFTAVTPGVAPDDAVGATRLPGLTLPGLANAHSHAFHRALRGITQAGRGTFWTWREQMYQLAARLEDRRDPMLPFAATVLSARRIAAEHRMLATVGKVIASPGAVNAISSSVSGWLDARAPHEPALEAAVAEIGQAAEEHAALHGARCDVRRESFTPRVEFDAGLRQRLGGALSARGIAAPVLPTGAGHDAGILAAWLPTAMLFVRNPTGVSHAPAEHAGAADCETGVVALAAVLAELASR